MLVPSLCRYSWMSSAVMLLLLSVTLPCVIFGSQSSWFCCRGLEESSQRCAKGSLDVLLHVLSLPLAGRTISQSLSLLQESPSFSDERSWFDVTTSPLLALLLASFRLMDFGVFISTSDLAFGAVSLWLSLSVSRPFSLRLEAKRQSCGGDSKCNKNSPEKGLARPPTVASSVTV